MRKREMKAGRFVALTLNEYGSKSFTYLKEAKAGQREIYFVNDVSTGSFTEATMLLGQFLFEFEALPGVAIPMNPGGTNRIYFPHDKRIARYDRLTEDEKAEARSRLIALAAKRPEHAKALRNLVQKI